MHPKKAKKTQLILKELDSIRLKDELNPLFIFSTTHRELLVQIATGRIKIKKLARQELQRRGLNKMGLWVGFEKEM